MSRVASTLTLEKTSLIGQARNSNFLLHVASRRTYSTVAKILTVMDFVTVVRFATVKNTVTVAQRLPNGCGRVRESRKRSGWTGATKQLFFNLSSVIFFINKYINTSVEVY